MIICNWILDIPIWPVFLQILNFYKFSNLFWKKGLGSWKIYFWRTKSTWCRLCQSKTKVQIIIKKKFLLSSMYIWLFVIEFLIYRFDQFSFRFWFFTNSQIFSEKKVSDLERYTFDVPNPHGADFVKVKQKCKLLSKKNFYCRVCIYDYL